MFRDNASSFLAFFFPLSLGFVLASALILATLTSSLPAVFEAEFQKGVCHQVCTAQGLNAGPLANDNSVCHCLTPAKESVMVSVE
jgi:hypothetical protein